MFYGEGYAGADDVVGHEMTHGVIERNSDLFYWGQSGAINESLADIMGEIVDHRNTPRRATPTAGRSARTCRAARIRNMSNPTRSRQPDTMTSGLWDARRRASYDDNGGVHTNSGVGNKTFVPDLAGRDVQRPDHHRHRRRRPDPDQVGDAVLRRRSSTLTSGSDYANLAAVLEQTCQALRRPANAHGFTAADCTNVAKAVTATRAAHHADQRAAAGGRRADLPDRASFRVLFDSEAGAPAAKFTAGRAAGPG